MLTTDTHDSAFPEGRSNAIEIRGFRISFEAMADVRAIVAIITPKLIWVD